MLGEIALYSFIVLLLSGTFLGLFFDPSMQEVTYDGVFENLRGVDMSRAFESSLEISFDVRGGLFIRQIHHWSALLFLAAMVAHMLRTFFTGAFRKPREANWVHRRRADPARLPGGLHRLQPPRRPALRHRAADHVRVRAVDTGDRHLDPLGAVRR